MDEARGGVADAHDQVGEAEKSLSLAEAERDALETRLGEAMARALDAAGADVDLEAFARRTEAAADKLARLKGD